MYISGNGIYECIVFISFFFTFPIKATAFVNLNNPYIVFKILFEIDFVLQK